MEIKYITGKELAERWRLNYRSMCNNIYKNKFPIKRIKLATNNIVFDMEDVIAYESSIKNDK